MQIALRWSFVLPAVALALLTPAAACGQERSLLALWDMESPSQSSDVVGCTAACDDCCECGFGSVWENTSLLLAADGWRTRLDDDDANNFGFRTGFNTALGWWDSPVRLQLGASYAGYDLTGRDAAALRGVNSAEEQVFATLGISKRSDVCGGDCLSWGVVYDLLYDDHLGEAAQEVKLTQVRFQTGWALSEGNEIGIAGAVHANRDSYLTADGGLTIPVSALDQISAFWHHTWETGADTTLYLGAAEDPGDFLLGVTGQAPLSGALALFGTATYIVPSTSAGDSLAFEEYSEEYWNISFGLVWYPGCKAASPSVSGPQGLPLLPVADNGTFAVDAPVGSL